MKAVLFYCGVCTFLIVGSIALRAAGNTSNAGPVFATLMIGATAGIILYVCKAPK